MLRALVIGCGNIGALSDLDRDDVSSHVKAYYRHSGVDVSVFDVDAHRAERVADKYGIELLRDLDDRELRRFDMVSICVSTREHTRYLKRLLRLDIPLIVCEKPISCVLDELDDLEGLYKSGSSSVLVNYPRRFVAHYRNLRQELERLADPVQLAVIKYARGLINNASHGIDLLYFFLDCDSTITAPIIGRYEYDCFSDDPTITLSGTIGSTIVQLVGLTRLDYAIFELELYTRRHRVVLLDGGNRIQWQEAESVPSFGSIRSLTAPKEFTYSGADIMQQVIDHAVELLQATDRSDNFISSLRLNRMLLDIVNRL